MQYIHIYLGIYICMFVPYVKYIKPYVAHVYTHMRKYVFKIMYTKSRRLYNISNQYSYVNKTKTIQPNNHKQENCRKIQYKTLQQQ